MAKDIGWTSKLLSSVGKEVLLRSVAQAIPSYCMSVFMLPISLCEELQRMMNSFWWGSHGNQRKRIHWLSWDRLCERKECSGLNFHHLH